MQINQSGHEFSHVTTAYVCKIVAWAHNYFAGNGHMDFKICIMSP